MSDSFSLEAILAIARNNAIGLDGKLPWHLPVELKLFKEVTMRHVLIMGRKTYESLPGRLPNREHIIISQTLTSIHGVHIAISVEHALSIAESLAAQKVFVIGGKRIFDELIPQCNAIHVSRIMKEYNADTYYDFNYQGYTIDQSHSLRDVETGTDILYQKLII
jgi:dihydrofolate reductase